MKQVEIKIYNIARTALNDAAVHEWLASFGVDWKDDLCFQAPASDAASLIGLAGKRCYLSFKPGINPNVTKIREDWTEYLDNVLASGHGSVLEHATYTWAIEGVSRVFTAEMNRHRAGVAISEGSMRYIRYEDIPFWMPNSIQPDTTSYPNAAELNADLEDRMSRYEDLPNELNDFAAWDLIEDKKARSRAVFERAFLQAEDNHRELMEIWKETFEAGASFKGKKQINSMMRRIIPIGVATGAVYALNFRALRHVASMRWEEAAEEEICFVWSQIGKLMIKSEPQIFGDFVEENGFIRPKYWKV